MVRTAFSALVLASVLVSGTVACGGESAGPKVVAGAPAGDVFDVRGTVTATRNGETRQLARGDVVSGDDVIDTGGDGNIAIRLRHNLVPWTLGPGKKEQVGLSLAWKAPRSTQTVAGPTGERSGAAGRHAEREAADTAANAAAAAETEVATATATDETAPAAPAPGGAPEPAAAPPPPPPPAPVAKAEESRREMAKVAEPKDAIADVRGGDVGDSFGSGGLGLSGTGKGGGGSGGGAIGLGDLGTIGRGGGTGTGQGYGAGGGGALGARKKPSAPQSIVRVFSARGGLETAVVTRVVRTRNPRLIACVEPDAPARAMVKLSIKPDGKVDTVTVSGVSLKASQCLEKWMRATAFPTAKEPTSVSVLVQPADPLAGAK